MKLSSGLAGVLLAACHPEGAGPSAPVAPPVENRDPLGAKIDAIAANAIAKGTTVGLSIAVAHHGKIVWAKGYGQADVAGHKAAEADTIYRIGSLTKQFTAAAIVQLAEAGKLKLGDEISRYVPEVPTAGNKVTIEQLLHHTSGIPNYTSQPGFGLVETTHLTPAAVVAIVKDVAWDFPAGSAWSYSNTGYAVLGMIIEKVSGETYAGYLAKHVFPRAGLVATTYCDESVPDPHRAMGYARGTPPELAQPIDLSTPYAAGAICSTVTDLLRWDAALAAGRVVSPAGYRAMTTSHGLAEHPYGFGLIPDDFKGHRVVWHNGGINGFVSELHDYVADGVTIAVLANTESDAAPTVERAVAMAELAIPSQAVAIAKAELTAYVGVFAVPVLGNVKVAIDDDHLVLTPDDQPTFALEYRGADTFALEAVGAMITFVREPTSKLVVAMRIKQGDKDIVGTRAN